MKDKRISSFLTLLLFALPMLILVVIVFTMGSANSQPQNAKDSVVIENGKQVIQVTAHGGYFPAKITAKAGEDTILRVNSQNSFGCERFFTIPKLNILQTLPTNGTTEFALGAQSAGTKITGTCTMGMYYFTINFE